MAADHGVAAPVNTVAYKQSWCLIYRALLTCSTRWSCARTIFKSAKEFMDKSCYCSSSTRGWLMTLTLAVCEWTTCVFVCVCPAGIGASRPQRLTEIGSKMARGQTLRSMCFSARQFFWCLYYSNAFKTLLRHLMCTFMCDLFEPDRSFTEPLCSPTGSPALSSSLRKLWRIQTFFFIWTSKSCFLSITLDLCGAFSYYCFSLIIAWLHRLISYPKDKTFLSVVCVLDTLPVITVYTCKWITERYSIKAKHIRFASWQKLKCVPDINTLTKVLLP